MTWSAPLRVACLGAGYFSQFHYDAWSRIDDVVLVGAADRNLAAAEATGLAAFADLQDLLRQAQPDLLDIIIPPDGHADAVEQAVDAGIHAIICQKPFCRDLAEAERVTELAEAAGTRLVIHENFRFQPWYRFIRSAIDAGQIGSVLQATFRLRPGDGQGPDAYLDRQPYFQNMPRFLVHETAVHWIDTFRFLFGDPQAVYADLARLNPAIAGEDAGVILFDHPNRVRALFDGNRLLDHAAENRRKTMGEGLVEGTGGALSLRGDGSVRLRRFGTNDDTVVLGPDKNAGFGGDCVYHLQKHVVSGLLSGGTIENTARDYLRVLRIRDAVYRSAEMGQKVTIQEVV